MSARGGSPLTCLKVDTYPFQENTKTQANAPWWRTLSSEPSMVLKCIPTLEPYTPMISNATITVYGSVSMICWLGKAISVSLQLTCFSLRRRSLHVAAKQTSMQEAYPLHRLWLLYILGLATNQMLACSVGIITIPPLSFFRNKSRKCIRKTQISTRPSFLHSSHFECQK